MSTSSLVADVRQPIDVGKLENYLGNLIKAPLKVLQFKHGQSNPTYLIKDSAGLNLVLRKQPPGALLSKSAHRIDREAVMMRALYGKIPVPKIFALCTDPDVLGGQFYVMEFLEGRIFHSPAFEEANSAEERSKLWSSAIKTLAQLHSLDPLSLQGLEGHFQTSKAGSHFPRQMKTLKAISKAQEKNSGPLEHLDATVAWLQAHMPGGPTVIVHGDYKVDNLIYHPTQPRVIGVLDWELCTIGHPLADVGNLLLAFGMPSGVDAISSMLVVKPGANGIPTLSQALAEYAKFSGYDPRPDFQFAISYNYLRLAVILQGIEARYRRGQASSANAASYGRMFPVVAKLAYSATLNTASKL